MSTLQAAFTPTHSLTLPCNPCARSAPLHGSPEAHRASPGARVTRAEGSGWPFTFLCPQPLCSAPSSAHSPCALPTAPQPCPQPPSSAHSPSALPTSPSALPGLAAFPYFYQALSHLILLLLSLTALSLLSQLQSQYFTLSLFPPYRSFFFSFKYFLPSVLLPRSPAISLCQELSCLHQGCASCSPLCSQVSPPHFCLPPPLAGSHPASTTASSTQRGGGKKDLWALILFPLFPPISCLVPLFPPPHGLCSPAQPVCHDTGQGHCSAIPASRLLQDTAQEEGFEVQPQRRCLGEQPCFPCPWCAKVHITPLRKSLLLSPLFPGSVSACL